MGLFQINQILQILLKKVQKLS